MRNPALQYPGDRSCSYHLCPNRKLAKVKRGYFIPLGEIKSFSAGMAIHVQCMKQITRGSGGTLDDLAGPDDTTEVSSNKEGV
jgi:hypothetical protein